MKNKLWRIYIIFQIVLLLFLAISVSAQHSIVIRTMLSSILPSTFTYSLDCASPLGTDAPSTLDDKDRETRYGFAERLNVDHYFALTGTSLSDDAIGQHRQVEFYGPITTPTYAANKGWLYTKDVSSVVELHWLDESDNEVQFTTGGKINANALGKLNNNTYLTAKDAAGTGTVNLIKADGNDVTVLPNGVQTATNTAPTQSKGLTNKKYVDDQIDATVGSGTISPTSYAGEESTTYSNGEIFKRGYVARAGNSTPVTFAVAFPNSCISVDLTGRYTTTGTNNAMTSVISKTGFTIYDGDDKTGYYWQAWGY